ncbi:MAG TPA: AAA family ATPase [Ignavibacteriales bacterium]|nr:AAA family ATPase [Ignavibacteriales bacterium]
MIIGRIKLNPFAGTSDRTIVFNKGLNVILGHNESGKSTLVNALKSALFVDTSLTPAKFKSIMGDFLPIGGGDTVHVSLEIISDGQTYCLEKYWGATKSSKLSLQGGGGYFTSSEEITEKMNALLGLNRGTYENVLIIRQASLAETIKQMEAKGEASESIQHILRNSRFRMDGVSVPKLRDLAREKVKEYFSHWDRSLGKPEGMRDYGNEWKKEVGKILKAYYSMRHAEELYNKAMDFEKRLDEIILKTRGVSEEKNCMEAFVTRYEASYEAAGRRQNLMLRKALSSEKIRQLVEVQKLWPRADIELQYLTENRNDLLAKQKSLEEEEKKAEAYEAQRSLREKYERAKKIFDDYLAEKEKVNSLVRITKQDLEQLEKASGSLDELRIKFEAQKLRLKIESGEEVKLSLTEGLKSPRDLEIKKDETYESTVSGSVSISAGHLKISVSSDNENISEIMEKLEASRMSYEELLAKFSVKNLAEFKLKADLYKEQFDKAKRLAEDLKKEIGEEPYLQLQERYLSLQEEKPGRSLSEVLKESGELGKKLTRVEKDIEEKSRQTRQYQSTYGSEEELSSLLTERKIEEMKLDDEIKKLQPLPKEFQEASVFIKEYEANKSLYEKKKDELNELKVEKAEHEKNDPGTSAEELLSVASETKESFERAKKEGEGYLLIEQELSGILEEIDRDTFEPLKKEVNSFLKKLTINKYSDVSMKEIVPEGVKSNGGVLPFEILSAGTKDILALSVRLGMAGFYLNGRKGFIIMDDPLVNLDPGRQRVAVEAIRQVSEEKQVIVLTCHPSHAELFGKGVISLT